MQKLHGSKNWIPNQQNCKKYQGFVSLSCWVRYHFGWYLMIYDIWYVSLGLHIGKK